jgi:hypothetical protein
MLNKKQGFDSTKCNAKTTIIKIYLLLCNNYFVEAWNFAQ